VSTKAPLGTVENPRGGATLGDKCRDCGEADLWSSFFDAEGNGSADTAPGARYLTLCQSCGTFYDTGRRAR